MEKMSTRTKLLKEMMRSGPFDTQSRKVPYLLCPLNKKPEEYSEQERSWLKQRDESRKAHAPSGWWNYFKDCLEVRIRGKDSLGLWISSSFLGENEVVPETMPFVLFLHGGGYSGLTWAPIIDELSRLLVAEYGALDLRGHGESECLEEADLSMETLTEDILDAITWMQESPVVRLGKRPLVIVGHSMGGAVGVNVCLKLQESNSVNVTGLVVLDVVEGSAMLALTSMHCVLKNRPQEFFSLQEAIKWCTKSGQTKNLDSARISMVGQLMEKGTRKVATMFVRLQDGMEVCDTNLTSSQKRIWDKDKDGTDDLSTLPSRSFVWRIDLSRTEPYWKGWFEGLSKKFLSVRCPKLLMLAGVDRLDKELTVGQMQGKFQMQVFHQVGHAVHEDAPEKAAECVASFLCRQRIATAKGTLPSSLPGC